MNGTGFIIDMKVLHELGFSINKQMKQISGIMERYRTAVNALINMPNFQGETADAVRAYFEEVHLEIISTLENSYGKSWRNQTKATFEAAKATGRKAYFQFEGTPSDTCFKKNS